MRPITYQEAAEVLAIELGENPRYDPDGRLLDPLDVLSLCGNLIVRSSPTSDISLDYFSTHAVYGKYGDPPSTSSVIQLAHLSVKDYLVSHDLKKSDLCMFALDTIIANRIMAQSCLVYLLQSTIISENYTVTYSSVEKNLDVNWPLYDYATHYCLAHIGLSDNTMDEQTWKLAQQLFDTQHHRNGGSYGFWLSALMGSDEGQLVAPKHHLYTMQRLLEQSLWLKRCWRRSIVMILMLPGGRYNSSPLHVACYHGHIGVLKLLLNVGADPNESNSGGESPLFWAICGSYHEIQKLLESHGAKLTPTDKRKLEDFVE